MLETEKYDFSFTASSLRLNEMILVAKAILENRQIDITNELGGGKSVTGKRMLSEFQKRISKLSSSEVQLLVNGDLTAQKQIAFVSVCKAYFFIRDFAIEVLREKLLIYDYQITEGDYITFYRRKHDLHPEMEKLTEITEKKVRQVTFKILEQVGLIDNVKSKVIQPQIIDTKVMDVVIDSDNAKWLQVLLMSDMDIAIAKN
jgi:hypothetical protein